MKEWITVKITFHTFLLGQVVAVQVLFSGKGITSPMAPKAAIETIKNIIISCTFKKKAKTIIPCWMHIKWLISIKQKKNLQSVVILADGHSSRFNYKVLH